MDPEGSRQLEPEGDRVQTVGDLEGANVARGEFFGVRAKVDVLGGEVNPVTYMEQSSRRVSAAVLRDVATVGLKDGRHRRTNCWADGTSTSGS
ncbi:hypothetical protein ROHU_016047 [Labeo rohita]|uniref:Uncharacterized protein n=1 Tax=Labeo rohita TaxID=84645 RepID=A0A498NLP9_LABRO|nr:hypothetical protein ROHU_016047 [Labeo rohita]